MGLNTITRIYGCTTLATLGLLLLLGLHAQRCEARPHRYRRDSPSCPLPTGVTCGNLLDGSTVYTTSAPGATTLAITYSSTTLQPTSQTAQDIRQAAQSTRTSYLQPLAEAYSNDTGFPDDISSKVLNTTQMQQQWSLETHSEANTLLKVLGNYYGLYHVYNCSINLPDPNVLHLEKTSTEKVTKVFQALRDLTWDVCKHVSSEEDITEYYNRTTTFASAMVGDAEVRADVRVKFIVELSNFFDHLRNESYWGN